MKKILLLFVSALILLTGCNSTNATEGNDGETKELILAHNQPTDHPVHQSLVDLKKRLKKKSNGKLDLKIYANGQLGSEREAIEMTQTNAIQFTKVSASALEGFSRSYSLFSMPYLFDSQESYRRIMKKPKIQDAFFNTTEDNGFIGLTYYDAGVRNMYTKDRMIEKPEDMKGLKTRVQPSQTSVQAMKALGATPTPMDFGEVYTALQSGVIDASENNETSLIDNKHGEVAKDYFYTEHQMVPDILIMNKEAYDSLTDQEQKWLKEAARESTESHEKLWDKEVEKDIQMAKEEMGVEFHQVDKSAFKEATKSFRKEFKKDEDTKEQYKMIEKEEKNEQAENEN